MAENETIGEPVALKVLNKQKIRKLGMQEKVKREVKAMKKLQHPHIICLYQVIDIPSDIFLVLELATGGDMYDRICTQGKVRFARIYWMYLILIFDMVVKRAREQTPIPLTDSCVSLQPRQGCRASRPEAGKFAV